MEAYTYTIQNEGDGNKLLIHSMKPLSRYAQSEILNKHMQTVTYMPNPPQLPREIVIFDDRPASVRKP